MAVSGQQALDYFAEKSFPDIVITDLKMTPVDGLQVLSAARNLNPAPEVILITAFASQQTAVEAMRLGAYDYLIKPFEIDELALRITRILKQKQLEDENRKLKSAPDSISVPNMIGKSERMREVYQLIDKVSGTDATVLIRGESGTGKELVAEAIHSRSDRKENRFIALNCAAVPENLLESELFGYEKGAFTGATQQKQGLFELAHEGTLFLDEIGDLPLGTQAKLLRALQNKEIIRVGGTEKINVDARLITATHRNLEEMIKSGEFRSDLFYRINIFLISMPPLREHREDIPELVQYFLEQHGNKAVLPEARKILMEYAWPGNIRELFNVLERSAIIAETSITVDDLPAEIKSENIQHVLYDIPDEGLVLDEVEKKLIQSALVKASGNKTRAAELLGITRRRMYSLIERFGIESESR
jgi:DNA-binding NtrC family response regulator